MRCLVTNFFPTLEWLVLFIIVFLVPLATSIATVPVFLALGILFLPFIIPPGLAALFVMATNGCKPVRFNVGKNDFCLILFCFIPYIICGVCGFAMSLVYLAYAFAISAAWFAIALPLLIAAYLLMLPIHAVNAVCKCIYPVEDFPNVQDEDDEDDWRTRMYPAMALLFRPIIFCSGFLSYLGGDDD